MKNATLAILVLMGTITGSSSVDATELVKVKCPDKINKGLPLPNGDIPYSGTAISRDNTLKFRFENTYDENIPKTDWIFRSTYQNIYGGVLVCEYAPDPAAPTIELHAMVTNTKCGVAGPSHRPRRGTHFECEVDEQQTKTKK